MPIYVHFLRGNVNALPGASTAKGHIGWVEVSSAQYGVKNTLASGTGAGGRSQSAKVPQDALFTLPKSAKAVSGLFMSFGDGKPFDKVVVDFVNDDGKTYLTWILQSAFIAHVSVSGNADPHSDASFSLASEGVTFDVNQKGGQPAAPTYDLATGTY